MIDLYKLAIEYETKIVRLQLRFKLYGVDENTFQNYYSSCIRKAVGTKYSCFELMEMLMDDHIRYGQLNLSSWILE